MCFIYKIWSLSNITSISCQITYISAYQQVTKNNKLFQWFNCIISDKTGFIRCVYFGKNNDLYKTINLYDIVNIENFTIGFRNEKYATHLSLYELRFDNTTIVNNLGKKDPIECYFNVSNINDVTELNDTFNVCGNVILADSIKTEKSSYVDVFIKDLTGDLKCRL